MTSAPAPRRASFPSPPVFLGVVYLMLTAAWVIGNPPGQAPDEGSHYLKALAVSSGRPAGQRPQPPPATPEQREEAWVQRTSREVQIPAGLSPVGLDCNAGDARISAACQDRAAPPADPSTAVSTVGTAQPVPHLLPGVLARLADSGATAIRLGRLGSAFLALGLLLLAVALLWDESLGWLSLAGLLMAVTPMVLFLTSSLNASGPEVGAGICFLAGLLRVTRYREGQRWPWAALAVSGALLGASRSLGPVWIIAHVQPHGGLHAATVWDAIRPSFERLLPTLGELVGVFGALDSPMPAFAYVLWWAMVVALLVTTLWGSRRRERVALVSLVSAVIVVTLGVAVLNLAQTGFGMQGRYVLPIAVTVPLLAGEILTRRRLASAGPSLDRLLPIIAGVALVVHGLGWYANARRSATGSDGPWIFVGSAEWAPPGGWYPLLALVTAVAVGGLVLTFALALRPGPVVPPVESLR